MDNGRDYVKWAREFLARQLTQGGYFASDSEVTRAEERRRKDLAADLIERSLITFQGNYSGRGWLLRGRDNDAPLLVYGYWEVVFLDFNFARACLFAYSELHPDMPAKLVVFEHEVSPPQSDYL